MSLMVQLDLKTFHKEVGEGKKIESFAGKKINTVLDYSKGLDGLPKSDVLKYLLDGNCSVVVRPSGTEPLVRVMIEGNDLTLINNLLEDISCVIENKIGIK